MRCLEVILALALVGDAVNVGSTAGAKEWGSIVCGAHEYQCENGACIPLAGRCNESKECADGSDESDCDYFLCRSPFWYKCKAEATCISAASRCDKHLDCVLGDDEDNCDNYEVPHKPLLCGKTEFTCTDKVCIPLDLMCDGIDHCPDGSDETIGCIDIASKCSGFLCRNKQCLRSSSWVCDGMRDCSDGSDEEHCVHECTLDQGKFECANNSTCIGVQAVCNGKDDCGDGSDEGPGCKVDACGQLACGERPCQRMPNGRPVCLCESGYRFSNVTHRCEDINECDRYGLCSQGCINTPGSFRCTCVEQFELKRDRRTCELTTGTEALMLYTTQRSIGALYLSSLHQYYVAKELSQVIGVSYDGQHVYWTDIAHKTESIERAQEDGSRRELLLTAGLISPEDIALDWLTGNIYFSDSGQMHIAVCTNDGFYCKAIVQEKLHKPRGIALLPQNGTLFYSDWGDNAQIGCARMDGSEQRIIVSEGIHWPNGLTLDWPNERLYWVDAKLKLIESMRFDGRDRTVILSGVLKHPFSVAVFNDRIYWSDWDTKSVQSCDKFTGKGRQSMVHDRVIFDVHIYHSSLQPKSNHPCVNHTCSHLCLLTSNATYACACPSGMMLQPNRHTCQETAKRQSLLLGIGSYLLSLKHHPFGRHEEGKGEPLAINISRLAFNSLTGEVLVADNTRKAIYAVNLATKETRALVTRVGSVSALAHDYLSNSLFWCDTERSTIEVYSLDTQHRSIVQHFLGGDAPVALALIPETGKMFIALRSRAVPWHTHIDQLAMTGRGPHAHVLEDRIGSNGSIAFCVDHDLRAVFWSDQSSGRIEMTSYEGDTRHLYRDYLRHPVSLTVLGDELFWTGYRSQRLYWSDKHNMGVTKRMTIPMPPGVTVPEQIPVAATQPMRRQDHPCRHRNGGCSHICVAGGLYTAACLCPTGMVFNTSLSKVCVRATDCEFRCESGQCLPGAGKRCNGHQDCPDGSDERNCRPASAPAAVKVDCHWNEFRCADGRKCIAAKRRCDKVRDCADASDEANCEGYVRHGECRETQFTCANGLCIDGNGRCDGYADCRDGSDELGCPAAGSSNGTTGTCAAAGMFRCTSGQCIDGSWECDGTPDCTDSSDEHIGCQNAGSGTCRPGYHRCTATGLCLEPALVCDGNDDCGDGSDEESCHQPSAPSHHDTLCSDKANASLFYCTRSSDCFNISARCNGTAECPHGEDEMDCPGCSPRDFACADGQQCIPAEWRCDKELDCADGSDERNCTARTTTSSFEQSQQHIVCGADEFECTAGECVSLAKVCDGKPDCSNGRDEGGSCSTACPGGRGPCTQKCLATPAGSVCSCFDGYELQGDRKSCADINECQTNGGTPCAQICTNIPGSYRCSCYDGYMLKADKTTCKATGANYYLLYGRFDKVRKLDIKPPTITTVARANGSRITSMDVNIQRGKLYYTVENTSTIFETDLAGNETRVVLRHPVGKPEKLAVDWVANNVYFIDGSEPSIKVCSLAENRGSCARLVTFMRQNFLKALCVDPVNKYLFFSVLYSWVFKIPHAIFRANLDGSLKEIVTRDDSLASALAVDHHTETLYYTDLVKNTLSRVDYDGKNVKVLVREQPHIISNPIGLLLHENHAIILNRAAAGGIGECELFGGYHCQRFSVNVPPANLLLLVQSTRQPMVDNVCSGHDCTHLCLPSRGKAVCVCYNGQSIAAGDRCPDSQAVNPFRQAAEDDPLVTDAAAAADSAESEESIMVKLLKYGITWLCLVALMGSVLYYIKWRRGKEGFDVGIHFHNMELSTLDKEPASAIVPGRVEFKTVGSHQELTFVKGEDWQSEASSEADGDGDNWHTSCGSSKQLSTKLLP